MNSTHWKAFTTLFQLVCFSAAFAMLCWCSYLFSKDEDMCQVSYKRYNDEKADVYPSFTMCLRTPLKKRKWNRILSKESYLDFLAGNEIRTPWNQTLMEVEYENITTQLNDHLINATVISGDATTRIEDFTTMGMFHSPWWMLHVKCFSFHIPYEPGTTFSRVVIDIKNSIFHNWKNSARPDGYRFMTFFHLPHQLTRAWPTMKLGFPLRDVTASKNYNMEFLLKAVEVVKRRNKSIMPCSSGKYDITFMDHVIKTVGCRPPYWKTKEDIPNCTNPEQMQHLAKNTARYITGVEKIDILQPCQEIENIYYTFADTEFRGKTLRDKKPSRIRITLLYANSKFKEMKQVRAYDVQSLIGNAGGYIGLFLGYALLQLPEFIVMVCGWIYKTILNCGDSRSTRFTKMKKSSNKNNKIEKGAEHTSVQEDDTTTQRRLSTLEHPNHMHNSWTIVCTIS